jgi:hypothetical protein
MCVFHLLKRDGLWTNPRTQKKKKKRKKKEEEEDFADLKFSLV